MRVFITFSVAAGLVAALAVPVSAQTPPARTAAKESDSEENRIRCRKIEVTGSLARKTKVCKTVAEWREIGDKGNRNVRDIVESGNVCAGGPLCNGQ